MVDMVALVVLVDTVEPDRTHSSGSKKKILGSTILLQFSNLVVSDSYGRHGIFGSCSRHGS